MMGLISLTNPDPEAGIYPPVLAITGGVRCLFLILSVYCTCPWILGCSCMSLSACLTPGWCLPECHTLESLVSRRHRQIYWSIRQMGDHEATSKSLNSCAGLSTSSSINRYMPWGACSTRHAWPWPCRHETICMSPAIAHKHDMHLSTVMSAGLSSPVKGGFFVNG